MIALDSCHHHVCRILGRWEELVKYLLMVMMESRHFKFMGFKIFEVFERITKEPYESCTSATSVDHDLESMFRQYCQIRNIKRTAQNKIITKLRECLPVSV